MNNKIMQMVNESEAKKVPVAELLALVDADQDEVVRAIDDLSMKNLIRVLRDKELNSLVVRPSGKVDFDLSGKHSATAQQIEDFYNASFTTEVFATNFDTRRRYKFNIVKLPNKDFADVFTADGKQAGFVKYISSTIHPWVDDFGCTHKVLQFTTIAKGRNIIDPSGISYWVNKDFYKEAFEKIHKEEGFKMIAMQAVVKAVINHMYPQQKDGEGKIIRRKSLRCHCNSSGYAKYLGSDLNVEKSDLTFVKENGENLVTVLNGDETVATASFRPFKNSDNYFESHVAVASDSTIAPAAVIEAATEVLKELSAPKFSNPFDLLK